MDILFDGLILLGVLIVFVPHKWPCCLIFLLNGLVLFFVGICPRAGIVGPGVVLSCLAMGFLRIASLSGVFLLILFRVWVPRAVVPGRSFLGSTVC